MSRLWNRQPVAVLGVVQATIVLLCTFGVSISKEQAGAIITLTAAILTVVARRKVTPYPPVEE